MLTKEITAEQVAEYRRIFEENRDLVPNRKTGAQVEAYFCGKYSPQKYPSKDFSRLVAEEIIANDFSREKLPQGVLPHVVCYRTGGALVGIDLVTGFFHVESKDAAESEKIYDRSIRTKQYKLVYNGFDFDEFYDLELDPHETVNRIGEDKYKDVIRDLYKRLWQFAYEHKDTCINPYIMVGLAQYGPGIIFGK